MHSHGSPAGLKCTFKFPPICSERVMYVDTITHARVHVWLCDNAGPAWQAPRIIALGRELHNNVGLGNACGLGLSAVSGPVNVALLALHVSAATHTHTHWHTHTLWEIDGTPQFSRVKKRCGLSLLIWMVKLFKIHTTGSSSHTVKQCWGLSVNPQRRFSQFLGGGIDEKLRWPTEQQHILWNKLPCPGKPTAKTDDHVLSACYY